MSLTFVEPPADSIRPESADLPEPEEVSVGADGSPLCVVCGKSLTYAGRGRKPKYCADHKPSPGRSSTGSGTATRTTKNDRMRRELVGTLALVGTGLMMVEPYDGLVILDRAEATVDALMDVAEHNPRVRKALEQMIDVTVWGALGTALAGILLPITAHHGLLPVDERTIERQFLTPDTVARLDVLRDASRGPANGEV